MPKTVAFLGPEGTYTDEACYLYAPEEHRMPFGSLFDDFPLPFGRLPPTLPLRFHCVFHCFPTCAYWIASG